MTGPETNITDSLYARYDEHLGDTLTTVAALSIDPNTEDATVTRDADGEEIFIVDEGDGYYVAMDGENDQWRRAEGDLKDVAAYVREWAVR
jgi:hypothetical protein